jgi:hypothetical protein
MALDLNAELCLSRQAGAHNCEGEDALTVDHRCHRAAPGIKIAFGAAKNDR